MDYLGAFKAWLKEVNPTQFNQEQLIQLEGKIKQFEKERQEVDGQNKQYGEAATNNAIVMFMLMLFSPFLVVAPGILGLELTQRLKIRQEQSS